MRPATAIVAVLLMAGCSSPQEDAPIEPTPTGAIPALANLTVIVCAERCGVGLPGAEVWINDEGPPRGVTDGDGRFRTTVPVPGEHRLEAFGPEGYTMEGGQAFTVAGNTTAVEAEVIVYRAGIRGQSTAEWSPPALGQSTAVAPFPFLLHDDVGIQISYQDRLKGLHSRITWFNDLGEDVRLLPCAGTDRHPALITGTRENESLMGERSGVLNPTIAELQPLLDALALGEILQLCVINEEEGFALDAVDVASDLSFSFEGKSTRRMAS